MARHKSGNQVEARKRSGGKLVIVNDKMQRGYRYVLTEPVGRNFDPEFKPELTPKEMLALGVFGGTERVNDFAPLEVMSLVSNRAAARA